MKPPDVFKVCIHDRTYKTWDYTPIDDSYSISFASEIPSPLHRKWFHQDIIDSVFPFEHNIVHSPVQTASYISGILILEGNKTYGRTKNKKRLLYRCIPDDRHLPHFLVPYDMIIDFCKNHKNKYVLFRFQEWTDEHPHGILVETLGDVNQFEAFYEYQLYSKSLHSSVKEMTQSIKKMTQKKSMEEYFQQILKNPSYKIQDLTQSNNTPQIFTIDPTNATDYDDALSIQTCPDTGFICVTVYIANVVFWLEIFQLWDSFDNRIATIYLPDKRRPMLPTILTESLCSLKENTRRFALSIQFYIHPETNKIDNSKTKIQNVMISVHKNYVYDEAKMVHQDVNYIHLLEQTIRLGQNIKNSRELVSFWMIQTNSWMAQYLLQHKTGIFRVGKLIKKPQKNTEEEEEDEEEKNNYEKLDYETKKYLEYHAKAESKCYNSSLDFEHEELKKEVYVRITSVIRRYEDICNECELMRIQGIKMRNNEKLKEYYNEELMNRQYNYIKRIESESEMLHRTKEGKREVEGVIYSRTEKEGGKYEYKVYIKGEGIKEILIRDKKEINKKYKFQRYIKEEKGLRINMEIVK